MLRCNTNKAGTFITGFDLDAPCKNEERVRVKLKM